MTDFLRQVYRTALIQIADDLTEEEFRRLLFFCKDDISRRYLSISSQASNSSVQIFEHLEDVQKLSWENLSYLKVFMHAIRREDLVTKLTAFEITRELTIYAWKRQGSGSSINPSALSVGHYLAEMMDLAQDRVDFGGLLCSLLQSGMNANDILDAVVKSLLGGDIGASGNWSTFALLVAIAAEIVSVGSKVKARDQPYKYAVKLATELGNHLSLKLAELGSWVSCYSYFYFRFTICFRKHLC